LSNKFHNTTQVEFKLGYDDVLYDEPALRTGVQAAAAAAAW